MMNSASNDMVAADDNGASGPSWWQRGAGRLLITVCLLACLWLMGRVPLVGSEVIDGLPFSVFPRASVLMLGMRAYFAAAVLVELAALLVPRWRALRHGGFEGRHLLTRATLWLTLLLATLQSYGAWWDLSAISRRAGYGAMLLAMVSLVGGVFVTIAVCALVTRYGIVNGFGVMLIAEWWWLLAAVYYTPTSDIVVPNAASNQAGVALLANVFGTILIAVTATVAVLWQSRRMRRRVGFLGGPGAGILPWLYAPLVLPLSFAKSPAWLASPSSKLSIGVAAVIAVVATVLFYPPDAVAKLLKRSATAPNPAAPNPAARANASILPVCIEAVCFILLISLSVIDDPRLLPWAFCSVVASAVLFDVMVELRARWSSTQWVAVWSAHRSYVPELVEQQLLAHDIPVFIRSVAQRRMLHIFGPFLPMDIFVPSSHVEAARGVMLPLLHAEASTDNGAVEAAPSGGGSYREAARASAVAEKEVRWVGGAFGRILPLAVPALMLLAMVFVQRAVRPPIMALATPVELEMLAVADDVEVFTEAVTADAPTWVDFESSNVPIGDGISRKRSRLFMSLPPGEPLYVLRRRLEPWFATLKYPADTHLHLGQSYDDAASGGERRAVVRSYLLRGASVITGANIVDAIAVPDDIDGTAFVMISLDDEGAQRFEQLTRENVRRRIAIVVDGAVISAPVVQEPIAGGEIRISMGAGPYEEAWREARELAASLRAGRR